MKYQINRHTKIISKRMPITIKGIVADILSPEEQKKVMLVLLSAGFLLRFETARTTLEIAGTKNGGGATILARNARSG